MNLEKFRFDVKTAWAVQKLRIQLGNRIYAFLVEEIIKNSSLYQKIKEMRKDQTIDKKKTEALIKKALIEMGYSKGKKDLELQKIFKIEKRQNKEYKALKKIEYNNGKIIESFLEMMPIYQGYLKNVKGMGALTSAKLLAIIGDIRRFNMISSLWHYCGVGKPEKLQRGKKASWNPTAKSLLLGVIAENFVKQRSQYRSIYDERKTKTLTTHPEWHNLNPDGTPNKGKNMHPKHAEKDARRVMIKRFLAEFWKAYYISLGLEPPTKPYILNDPKHHEDPDIVSYKFQ